MQSPTTQLTAPRRQVTRVPRAWRKPKAAKSQDKRPHRARTGPFLIRNPNAGPFAKMVIDQAYTISDLRSKFNALPLGTTVLVENPGTGYHFTANTRHALQQEEIDYLVDGRRTPEGDWYLPKQHPRQAEDVPTRRQPVSTPQEDPPMSNPTPDITLYTDGSCKGNPGPAGYAAVLVQGQPAEATLRKLAFDLKKAEVAKVDGHRAKAIAGYIGEATNNVAELSAVLAGLRYITKPSTVLVFTDSANVIGWLSQDFKRKNPLVAALCGQIDQVIASTGLVVRYAKVDGHAGVALNELVDRLASRQVELGKAGACQAAPLV